MGINMSIIGLSVGQVVTQADFNVKLGSNMGGAFVFCGNVKDIDISQIDNDVIDAFRRSKKAAQGEYQRLKAMPKDFDSFSADMIRKRKKAANKYVGIDAEAQAYVEEKYPITPQEHIKWRRELLEKKKKALSRSESMSRQIAQYTSIENRKIINAYKSIDEDNTMILIFEGRETGAYWTMEEYRTGLVENDEGFKAVRTMTNIELFKALLKKGAFDQVHELICSLAKEIDEKSVPKERWDSHISKWLEEEAK